MSLKSEVLSREGEPKMLALYAEASERWLTTPCGAMFQFDQRLMALGEENVREVADAIWLDSGGKVSLDLSLLQFGMMPIRVNMCLSDVDYPITRAMRELAGFCRNFWGL